MMEDIPFRHVSWGTMVKLANKLDPESTVKGNNWKMLAEKLGYSTGDILCFESQQSSHGRNTIKVLEEYIRKNNSTVNELLQALKDIDRPDAVMDLEQDLPEIQKKYKESLTKRRAYDEPVEHEYHSNSMCSMCMSQGSGHAYPSMHYPTHSMPHRHGCTKHLMLPVKFAGADSKPHNKMYLRNNSAPGGAALHHGHGMDVPMSYEQFSLSRMQRQVSDSMVVQHPCDGHSQYISMEPMDQSPAVREDPLPLAAGIMRNQQHYDRTRVPPMNMTVEQDADISPSCESRGFRGNCSTGDDRNFRPPYMAAATAGRTNRAVLKLSIPKAAQSQGGGRHEKMEDDSFCSPSPTPTTPVTTPLAHLTQLANLERFQPEEGYTSLMMLKREQELLQKKASALKPEETSSAYSCQVAHGSQEAADFTKVDSKLKRFDHEMRSKPAMEKDAPNTFPLRIKSSMCVSSASSSASASQGLMKSMSMPNDMKPAEFRKAFRYIKVFVTYSGDSKKHTQRVLNLCRCLEKNGFTCCVDIYHRKLQIEDKVGWYEKRFQEADFILVVVSPKYKQEADMCDTEADADASDNMDSDGQNDVQNHQLHTKHIYHMMCREYEQNNSRNYRFVPILFEGMQRSLIPSWMRNGSSPRLYIWPREFKDLLWMLTKPEDRIKPRPLNIKSEEDSIEGYSESNNETD